MLTVKNHPVFEQPPLASSRRLVTGLTKDSWAPVDFFDVVDGNSHEMAVAVRITEYMDRRLRGNVHTGCVHEIKEHAARTPWLLRVLHTHACVTHVCVCVCLCLS